MCYERQEPAEDPMDSSLDGGAASALFQRSAGATGGAAGKRGGGMRQRADQFSAI